MMAILIDVEDSDPPEVMCSECEAVFTIIWRNDGLITGVGWCPFCGADMEDETT